jgi:hypothetical protein
MKFYTGDQMMENENGRAYGTHGRDDEENIQMKEPTWKM